MSNRKIHDRNFKLAAYAVAMAAAVGGAPAAAASPAISETQAIEQIERYCTASWRNAGIEPQEWDDCTQQAILELLERLPRDQFPVALQEPESAERRELNRSVWRAVQRWRRRPRPVDYSVAELDAPQEPAGDLWEQVATAGREYLSPRQNQILALTRDGWRVQEIAAELDLPPQRVSDEKYKAIARLRGMLDA
jgi:hypothetical protein